MNNLKLINPYSFKRAPFKYLSYRHQIRKWKKERAEYGFSIHDTFELNTWFYFIIPEMVKVIRDNKYGMPGFLFIERYFNLHKELPISYEDYCNNIDSDDEVIKKISDDLLNEHNKTLDLIIYTFNESMEDTCSLNDKTNIEEYLEENKRKALELFVKNIDLLWW